MPISLIYEKVMLGTAGTLKHLLNKVSQDNFIVMHADNYFEDDLENLKVKHIESGEDILVTMGTFKVSNPAEFGTVELSDKGTVIDFFEKSTNSTSNIANSAVYIIKPTAKEIIESLSSAENDISLNLIPKLLGKIKAEPLNGYFYDIGTPEILKLANDL